MLELRVRTLLVEFTIETLLHPPADILPTGAPRRVVAERQRLPAPIDLDCGGQNVAGLIHERFGLLQDPVGRHGVPGAPLDRVEPLAREPGDAAVLVAHALEQATQRLGCVHALGRGGANRGVLRANRDVDQRVLVADRCDRRAAARFVGRVQHELRAQCVGEFRRSEQRVHEGIVGRNCQQLAERCGVSDAHRRLGFRPQRRGECSRVTAACAGSGADLRCRISEHLHEHLRVGRQGLHALDAPRRVGALMQTGTEDNLVEHVEVEVGIRTGWPCGSQW